MPYLTTKTKTNPGLKPTIIGIAIMLVVIGFVYLLNKEKSNSSPEYYKSLVTAENHEIDSPEKFIKSDGTYRKTLFANKYRIQGSFISSAVSAIYKDVVFEVYFFSKTKTQLGSSRFTVYEILPPGSLKHFDVRVIAPKGTQELSWSVVDAAKN
ncbi:hypothetical protein [Dyadobacter sp. NIV53]|uniref:hypothetical protein n=1 Tax=Dyadobacter sp. NIV53 TaxID=2861765 RepID=UPI001C88988A|nr:hypothetical protein [Dyadobacter sp. NIV53]